MTSTLGLLTGHTGLEGSRMVGRKGFSSSSIILFIHCRISLHCLSSEFKYSFFCGRFILNIDQCDKLQQLNYLEAPCPCYIKSCISVNIAWCQVCPRVHQQLHNFLTTWKNSMHKACLSTTIHTVQHCTSCQQLSENFNWTLHYHWEKFKNKSWITRVSQ